MTCKDCKFFVQGEKHDGTCEKKPYMKSKGGIVHRKPDGTPFVFRTYWGASACKEHFERRESDG